jgi:hypothetical protein
MRTQSKQEKKKKKKEKEKRNHTVANTSGETNIIVDADETRDYLALVCASKDTIGRVDRAIASKAVVALLGANRVAITTRS